MFAGKARPYPSELPLPLHFHCGLKLHITIVNYDRKIFIVQTAGLIALPANIRLGWKWLTVKNILAYRSELITAVKKQA